MYVCATYSTVSVEPWSPQQASVVARQVWYSAILMDRLEFLVLADKKKKFNAIFEEKEPVYSHPIHILWFGRRIFLTQ